MSPFWLGKGFTNACHWPFIPSGLILFKRNPTLLLCYQLSCGVLHWWWHCSVLRYSFHHLFQNSWAKIWICFPWFLNISLWQRLLKGGDKVSNLQDVHHPADPEIGHLVSPLRECKNVKLHTSVLPQSSIPTVHSWSTYTFVSACSYRLFSALRVEFPIYLHAP